MSRPAESSGPWAEEGNPTLVLPLHWGVGKGCLPLGSSSCMGLKASTYGWGYPNEGCRG